MTYSQAQIKIFKDVDSLAADMGERMLKNYDRALKEIEAELDTVYSKILSGLPPEKYYNEMLKYTRLEKLQIEAQKIYNEYARKANRETLSISKMVMVEMYYRKEYAMSAFTLATYQPIILDPRLIELTIMGTTEAWKDIPLYLEKQYGSMSSFQPQYGTITKIFSDNKFDDLRKIQNAFSQIFIQGKGSAEAAKILQSIFETTKYNAQRIVQTEFTRIANAAAYAANKDAENQGIDIQKMWQANPTTRPHRPPHMNLDGVKKKPDEYFSLGGNKALYPGNFDGGGHNYNCHCYIIDTIGDIDPFMRRARNPLTGKNEVFNFSDYEKWRTENKF